MLTSIRRFHQRSRSAYSSRYTALATPTGTMNTAHRTMSHSVPMSADWMPDSSGRRRDGNELMNSHETSGTPSAATSTSRTPRNTTAIMRQSSRLDAEQQLAGALAAGGALDDAAGDGGLGDGHGYSYTCRYLRTKRIAMRLSTSVMTKSVAPTAKIVA